MGVQLIKGSLIDNNKLTEFVESLSELKITKLKLLVDLIWQANQSLNLTAHKQKDEIWQRLILESIIPLISNPFYPQSNDFLATEPKIDHNVANLNVAKIVNYHQKTPTVATSAQTNKALDLGSGAGIPGFVLAIICDQLQFYSIDKSPKKIQFQQLAIQKLKLTNIFPINDRIEYYQAEKFNLLLVRAFKSISHILNIAQDILLKNGKIIMWKGEKWQDEWQTCPVELINHFQHIVHTRYDLNAKSGGVIIELQLRDSN